MSRNIRLLAFAAMAALAVAGCKKDEEGDVVLPSLNGRLSFGPRSYKWLILMEVESMSPETAAKLEKFAASGGRILCIGKKPHKSAGFNDYEKKTVEVERIIGRIEENYPDRFLFTESPEGNLTEPSCASSAYIFSHELSL